MMQANSKTPSGTRVLETVDGKLLAAYDFSGVDGTDPHLVGGISLKSQISALASGLRAADKLSETSSESPELRLLKVPSLNFEAFWLHYADSSKDVFVPIGSAMIPKDQAISPND
jgi:hypothetical protein